jgi:(2Fe-2S) ferredoxin
VVYRPCRERFSITDPWPSGRLDAEAAISKTSKKKLGNDGVALLERKRPGAKVRDYGSHVLVCCGGDCKKRGAKDVRKALKGELRERGMLGEVRVDDVKCMGLCKHGPNVVVHDGTHPGGTWYLGLTERDVPEVVEGHLEGGEPVERLAAEKRARKRKARA